MRLNVKALAITCGLLWGLGLFFVTLWVMIWDGSSGDKTWLANIYRGYNISLTGGLIGLVWGLIDGAVGGLIFGWLYNLILDKCSQPTSV